MLYQVLYLLSHLQATIPFTQHNIVAIGPPKLRALNVGQQSQITQVYVQYVPLSCVDSVTVIINSINDETKY